MKQSPKVIAVTSGKGGVGKTVTTVNLAASYARMGYRVMILDGDMGLANVDVVLGLQARYTIRDVLDGTVSLNDIIIEGPLGIQIIPSGSGIQSLTALTYVQKVQLVEEVEKLKNTPDILLIDTGAGISSNVVNLNALADQVLVVTTPEPHSITDAYALVKVLSENNNSGDIFMAINQCRSRDEGERVFDRVQGVINQFLQTKVIYAGSVPFDTHVQRAVMQRNATSADATHTLAGQAWNQVSRNLLGFENAPRHESTQQVWEHLIWNDRNSVTAR